MEISELQTIIEKSGLSNYRIEKDLKITNGTLAQVLKGTKKLPEKYEESLRGLVALDLDKVEKIATGEEQGTISDAMVPAKPELTIEEVPKMEEVKVTAVPYMDKRDADYKPITDKVLSKTKQVKRPDMSIADLL